MKRANILCLLLAVAGLSFGVGQMVGQDAGADAQQAKVQKVKDSQTHFRLHLLFQMERLTLNEVRDVEAQTHAVCENIRYLAGPDLTNQRPCPPERH